MKRFFHVAAIILVSLAIGGVTAWVGIFHWERTNWVRNGPWLTNELLGSKDLDMYSRAYVAVKYLFALNKTETLYYAAYTDERGKALKTDCDYVIHGESLPARWWSITAYGEDQFLIPNKADRYSVSSDDIAATGESAYKIHLSTQEKDGFWIPTGGPGRRFSLVLRLYNPEPAVYEKPSSYPLPRIVREECP